MKIIITGGAGFIGTHLTRRLLEDGHEVIVIDNESNSTRDTVPPGARFVFGDVTDPVSLTAIFAEGADAVCHLAGQVSIIRAFDNPVGDLRINTEGTINVVRACLDQNIPRLIYASSMTAYGNTDVVPTPESHPCRPDSYYGITKFSAERYVHATADRPDLEAPLRVTSLRMFSVFGPGQAWDNPYQGVLGIFLGRIQRGEPIIIFGDGEQTRDFVFIDDIIDGWIGVLENPNATSGGIFNLGSGHPLSINELAAKVLAAHGISSGDIDLRYAPMRPGEQRSVQADIRLADEVFGWRPKTEFDAGLVATMQWAGGANDAGLARAESGKTGPATKRAD